MSQYKNKAQYKPQGARPAWPIEPYTLLTIAAILVGLGIVGAGLGLFTLPFGQNARPRAEAGVTRNADWKPYTEVLGGVEMALVPAGCFQMGSNQGQDDEWPVHEVCFEQPFWIDVYEVINMFVRTECTQWSSNQNQPRICVDWYAAKEHCASRGARLPTEAEWEYAARGPDGLMYPWGNTFIADNVVFGGNSDARTWDVGSRPGGVSWVGAYDLSGNVAEWVNDWYDSSYYGTLASGAVNPQGPSSGGRRVLRGGSWFLDTNGLRATDRQWDFPDYKEILYGFRCARSYQP